MATSKKEKIMAEKIKTWTQEKPAQLLLTQNNRKPQLQVLEGLLAW